MDKPGSWFLLILNKDAGLIDLVTILLILAEPGTPQAEEEQFLSRAFFWVALFFILWLMLV